MNENEDWSITICFWVSILGELLNPMFCFIQTLIKALMGFLLVSFCFDRKLSSKSYAILEKILFIPA